MGPQVPFYLDSPLMMQEVVLAVTHANFISNNHLSLNISITLRRGPQMYQCKVFLISQRKEKKVTTNMIKLAKIKSKAVSVLKECTHYNF